VNDVTDLESTSKKIIDLLEQAAPWFSLDKPGDVIQCPPSALREGRFYVMGFNPGISKKSSDHRDDKSLRKTTQALVSAKANDAHPLSKWSSGWSHLMKLAEALEVKDWQRNLFIANLFPDSSEMGVEGWKSAHGGRQEHLDCVKKIWPLHQLFLSIVRPRFVIVHGQGSKDSAFFYLWKYLVQQQNPEADWNKTMAPETSEDPSIKSFSLQQLEVAEGEPLSDVTFIGIKHLSYPQSSLDVMKKLIRQ
jgi:hypothetical protein